MWNVSPKLWHIYTKLHGVTRQNVLILNGRSLPPVGKCSRIFFLLPRYGVKSRSRRLGSVALMWRCSRDVASLYGPARCNIALFLICHACNSERRVNIICSYTWERYVLLAAREPSEGTGKTNVGVCVESYFTNTLHSLDASLLNWEWHFARSC